MHEARPPSHGALSAALRGPDHAGDGMQEMARNHHSAPLVVGYNLYRGIKDQREELDQVGLGTAPQAP